MNVLGFVEVVDELGSVQEKVYGRPTVLIAGKVHGEEEIPEGAVALLTPDMPDILSHVSVRARNSKVKPNESVLATKPDHLSHLAFVLISYLVLLNFSTLI